MILLLIHIVVLTHTGQIDADSIIGSRFPSAGSSYVFAKETMGEEASVIAAACLTLEYTGSASAVARSWGDKVVTYIRSRHSDSILIPILDPGLGINPCAFVVSLGSILLLLKGVKESKAVTNFFSSLNVSLVFFMSAMSIFLAKKENLTPLIPPEFGASGILRGATSSFFGYIGFDEICCVSGEAKEPSKNIPRAILLTLIIVTFLYISASLGLVGMVPYKEISGTSGFPNGFRYAGYDLAAEITAVSHYLYFSFVLLFLIDWLTKSLFLQLGELTVLPVVVLVTIMAQPRLTYAMSVDGLLPPIFAEMDSSGNLNGGTRIAGTFMVMYVRGAQFNGATRVSSELTFMSVCFALRIATFVPFSYLDDLISSGILLAFTITDVSVILVRQTPETDSPFPIEKKIIAFNTLSFVTSLFLRNCSSNDTTARSIQILTIFSCAATLFIGYQIQIHSDWSRNKLHSGVFLAPFMPALPLTGCFVNLYLIAQLELSGLLAITGYIGVFLGLYVYKMYR